jgi:hypothetical protein
MYQNLSFEVVSVQLFAVTCAYANKRLVWYYVLTS